MNRLDPEYPFADCVDEDLTPTFLARGLVHLLRGAAATLLAPFEILEHLKEAQRMEHKTGISWMLSATIYLCVAKLWTLSPSALNGGSQTLQILLVGVALALTIVNGLVQRKRTTEAQLTAMFDHLGRVA